MSESRGDACAAGSCASILLAPRRTTRNSCLTKLDFRKFISPGVPVLLLCAMAYYRSPAPFFLLKSARCLSIVEFAAQTCRGLSFPLHSGILKFSPAEFGEE